MKYKYTQIEEIINFLEDPDVLEKKLILQNLNLINTLDTHESKIESLTKLEQLVNGLRSNNTKIDSNYKN